MQQKYQYSVYRGHFSRLRSLGNALLYFVDCINNDGLQFYNSFFNAIETVWIARGYHVYIGKTYKGEVDFIAEKGDEKFYVPAAYLLSDEQVVESNFF